MKNTIMLDHENGRIVMDRTFANLAVNVRTEEYKILQEVRLAYPTYIVVRRTIKKNPNRECYRGLTYPFTSYVPSSLLRVEVTVVKTFFTFA